MVRRGGLEPPRHKAIRPSNVHVYRFRHLRMGGRAIIFRCLAHVLYGKKISLSTGFFKKGKKCCRCSNRVIPTGEDSHRHHFFHPYPRVVLFGQNFFLMTSPVRESTTSKPCKWDERGPIRVKPAPDMSLLLICACRFMVSLPVLFCTAAI